MKKVFSAGLAVGVVVVAFVATYVLIKYPPSAAAPAAVHEWREITRAGPSGQEIQRQADGICENAGGVMRLGLRFAQGGPQHIVTCHNGRQGVIVDRRLSTGGDKLL